jgi:hypothetical protein
VEPWSNTQLWPLNVTGSPGLLCSLTETSGTHTEPSVLVKVFGDQFEAVAVVKPPGGKFVPSLHAAQARFCSMKVNAVVVVATRRNTRAEHEDALRRFAATVLAALPANSGFMLLLLEIFCRPFILAPGRQVAVTSKDVERERLPRDKQTFRDDDVS